MRFDEDDLLDDWDDSGLVGDGYEADYSIIGTDDRIRVGPSPTHPSTRLFPFNTVCYIQIWRDRAWHPHGSGTLVTPRVVLTAGHVLAGRPILRVTPGAAFDAPTPAHRSSGRPASIVARPTTFRISPGYSAVTPTDFGIIVLPRPFSGPTRFMPLQARAASRSAVRVTVGGFPGDKNLVTQGTMWFHSQSIDTVATADGMLRHQVDTMPGNSGGPIWLLGGNGVRILLGIHVGGAGSGNRNQGVRITNTVIARVRSWCAAARVAPPTMWPLRS